MASGGTELGSAIDFATPWLKFVLGFLGITDIEVIAADRGCCAATRPARALSETSLGYSIATGRRWPKRFEIRHLRAIMLIWIRSRP